jgi:HlyD family secretion protein
MTENTTRVDPSRGWSVRKALWWGLCVVVLLAAGGFGAWWWKFRDTLHYVTARVTRGDIRRSINMTGAMNPVVTAQVGSFVSGNIKSWSCDYNSIVKIGQSCAHIDPLPFQVVVDEDEADVRTSGAQLAKDKAAVANARVIYERDSKLREEGIVSQETLDGEKATLDQDTAQIALDGATIAAKRAALHAAQVNLGYTNIVSPVDGMVITRYIDVGYTVVSSLQSSTLFLIGKDMKKMQVDTNVSEADVGEVHDGEKANFTVQAYPTRTFEATVRQVRRGPITVQNVVTYDVVLDVNNDDMALLPGMTADTHIITAERKNVLRVPLPATRFVPEGLARAARNPGESGRGRGVGGADAARDEGGQDGRGAGRGNPADASATRRPRQNRGGFARLWVLRDGKLTPVHVRTGLDDGTLIEVSSDELKPGDEVVVNAVRPNAPRGPAGGAGERAPGTGQGAQPGNNAGRAGGFRL